MKTIQRLNNKNDLSSSLYPSFKLKPTRYNRAVAGWNLGDTKNAIRNYKMSLVLDSKNDNAKKMIRKLQTVL